MPEESRRPPNVILIIMDDLCWGDLACHGNPYTHTPNLDRLHAESARLTRYCSGPMCTPARSSILTGRYAYRTRAFDTSAARSSMDPDEMTIAEILRDAGYRTGAFGKWHLGDTCPTRAMDQGFDETVMHLGGALGVWADHLDNQRPDGYNDPMLMHNGKAEKYKGYGPDIFTNEAIRLIRECSDAARDGGLGAGDTDADRVPFLAYLATNTPHTPLRIADKWVDRYRKKGVNETHAKIYGMVENIDYNVGRILDTLDELGIAEETVVIYTSDHGPCNTARNFDAPPGEQVRFNAGLRDIKGTIYEGGIRVPSLWRYTGTFPAGRDIDRVASTIDVVPTLAALCGAALPDDRKIDGIDLSPLLTGARSPEDWPVRSIFMQWHRGDAPIRYRNYGVITQRYKLTRPTDALPDELYDLVEDPLERNDIAAQHPGVVEKLRAEYDAWLDDVSSTRPDNYLPPQIHVGSDRHNPITLHRHEARGPGIDVLNDRIGVAGWRAVITESGDYSARIVFNTHFPPQVMEPGTVHLYFGDLHVMQPTVDDVLEYTFDAVELTEGPAQINAWMDSRNNYVAALWLEIERHSK